MQAIKDSSAHFPRPINILVAEDNEVSQLLLKKVFQKQGYMSRIVGNGQEALASLESPIYDLIMMDLQMPIMDGIQATAKIR